MKLFFINIVCKFHEFGMKRRVYIFSLLAILWCLAVFSFSQIQLSNSSFDLLPDSSVKLQKMAQGMDLAPFSRLLYIDFYHADGDNKKLIQAANALKASIPSNLAIPINMNLRISPASLMKLLPAFFTQEAEEYATKKTQALAIKKSVQETFNTLSTFATNALIPWLRIDPLNFKSIVTKNLPQSLNTPSNDMVSEYIFSKDKKHLLLVFQPLFSMHDTDAAIQILTHIRNSKVEFPLGVEINLNGGVIHTGINTETVTNDIETIIFFSFIGLIGIYIFLVRSMAGIWLLLTPCLAVGFSLGIMTGLSASLSGLALGFGAAVLGIAEDYAVHIHCALQKEKKKRQIFELLTIPLFQGFMLNASGFSILLFSSIPAVRQLAMFALLSLFFGFLIAIFILPLCPQFYKKASNKAVCSETTSITAFESPSLICQREPVLWKCVLTLIILALACIFIFFQSPIDVSPKSMGVALNSGETNTASFMQIWGQDYGDVLILEDSNEEALFEKARIITDAMSEDNTISTLAYFLPSMDEQQDNIARWNIFIKKYESDIKNHILAECKNLGVDSILFDPFFKILKEPPLFISLESLKQNGFSNLVDFFVSSKKNTDNTIFQTLLVSSKKINEVKFAERLNSEPALLEQLTILSPEHLEKEIRSLLYLEAQYIPIALIFCALLLYFCFFNFSKTFLALIPALFSMLCILVGMYFLQRPITLGTIAALPLVLGLALDHGILVSCDLEHGINLDIRKALLISSLTTCMGMGLLAFAEHPTLRDMGQVIFLGLLVEIPVSLYFLPLLCKEKTRSTHETHI